MGLFGAKYETKFGPFQTKYRPRSSHRCGKKLARTLGKQSNCGLRFVGKGHGTFLVRFVISEALVGIAKFIVEKKEEIARE